MSETLTPKQARFVEEYLIDLNATQAAIRAGLALRECYGAIDYYVYLLVDSVTQEIFYVGKGKGRRYAAHVREWRTMKCENGKKEARIGDVFANGGEVQAYCFADGLIEDAAYRLERAVIRAIGLKNLTNADRGRETSHERTIWHAKAALARIKPFDVWMAEAARSSDHQEMYWKILEHYRYIASGRFMRDCETYPHQLAV